MKRILFGVSYVSFWVFIWGTVGSLIDSPLLQAGFYLEGTVWQYTTFLVTAIIFIALGFVLYPKVLQNSLVSNAFGLVPPDKKS
tara:strand:- start:314 stop:565 length:252 start_codon:yes stop_codon:yes gene_type:complete